jgi:hypothetical protein
MIRSPYRLHLRKNSLAKETFLKALDDFRGLIRKHKFIKITPYVDYLKAPTRKKDFLDFVNGLEEFRCHAVGLNPEIFYKLCAEFILVPNGVKYYNPIHLFGCKASFEADEFRERLFYTLIYISSSIMDGIEDNEKTYEFMEKVNQLRNLIEFRGVSPVFKPKDWYCIKTIHRRAESKGWSIDELVSKIKVFYSHRIRKVYPEMLLRDFVRGELDKVGFNSGKKIKTTVPKHIQAIKGEDWYEEWKNQIPDD